MFVKPRIQTNLKDPCTSVQQKAVVPEGAEVFVFVSLIFEMIIIILEKGQILNFFLLSDPFHFTYDLYFAVNGICLVFGWNE